VAVTQRWLCVDAAAASAAAVAEQWLCVDADLSA